MMAKQVLTKFDGQSYRPEARALPEERAVAISVGGSTHAVMMARPTDLEDFAFGFLHSDGVIASAEDVERLDIVEAPLGLDLQLRLRKALAEDYRARKRTMAGPVGCGLCGVESLELAVPELESVSTLELPQDYPWRALQVLQVAQKSRAKTGALHGAALLDQAGDVVIAREDIGRHNAMDKVIGATLREEIALEGGVIVLSSRVSIDLVIKAVRAGVSTLIARATPSDLALEYARKWQLNLIAPVFPDAYFQSGENYE